MLDGDLVPVGRAVDGTEVLLCDEAGGAVARGAVGEIVVRGALLAAGYWQRPVLEAERFGRDPYGAARAAIAPAISAGSAPTVRSSTSVGATTR